MSRWRCHQVTCKDEETLRAPLKGLDMEIKVIVTQLASSLRNPADAELIGIHPFDFTNGEDEGLCAAVALNVLTSDQENGDPHIVFPDDFKFEYVGPNGPIEAPIRMPSSDAPGSMRMH